MGSRDAQMPSDIIRVHSNPSMRELTLVGESVCGRPDMSLANRFAKDIKDLLEIKWVLPVNAHSCAKLSKVVSYPITIRIEHVLNGLPISQNSISILVNLPEGLGDIHHLLVWV